MSRVAPLHVQLFSPPADLHVDSAINTEMLLSWPVCVNPVILHININPWAYVSFDKHSNLLPRPPFAHLSSIATSILVSHALFLTKQSVCSYYTVGVDRTAIKSKISPVNVTNTTPKW